VLIPIAVAGVTTSLVANRPPATRTQAWLPLLPSLSAAVASRPTRPSSLAVFAEFAKLGVTVFGGGYVLLAFLRADLVTHLHWLTERQVLDAVAAGQVTPGPVFTTATFVGYLVGGTGAAVLATAGIFLPSFVMVAAIEPLVGRIRTSRWLGPALDGITVASLGLMTGVAVDLARTAITDPLTAILAAAALAVLLRWKLNGIWLVLAGAAIGVAHALL
jgi:chromate transporter